MENNQQPGQNGQPMVPPQVVATSGEATQSTQEKIISASTFSTEGMDPLIKKIYDAYFVLGKDDSTNGKEDEVIKRGLSIESEDIRESLLMGYVSLIGGIIIGVFGLLAVKMFISGTDLNMIAGIHGLFIAGRYETIILGVSSIVGPLSTIFGLLYILYQVSRKSKNKTANIKLSQIFYGEKSSERLI